MSAVTRRPYFVERGIHSGFWFAYRRPVPFGAALVKVGYFPTQAELDDDEALARLAGGEWA